MEDIPANAMHQEIPKEEPARLISGFWRRVAAFLLDSIILGIVGFVVGTMFFDFFMQLGGWGRVFGSLIALLYLGIFNSSLAHGQTVGKRVLKIRVVDKDGRTISPMRSFARFMILGPPFFLNGVLIPSNILMNPFVAVILALIVFFMGGAIIYLYIFNRRTRQSLHDLVVGSYVIKVTPSQEFSPPPFWKGHLVAVGMLFIAVIAFYIFAAPSMAKKDFFIEMLPVQMSLQSSGLVHTVGVSAGKTVFFSAGKGKVESKYFMVNAVLKNRPSDGNEIARDFAAIVLNDYPRIMEKDVLVVNVKYGYDIGIARAWKGLRVQYSPEEWRTQLNETGEKEKFEDTAVREYGI